MFFECFLFYLAGVKGIVTDENNNPVHEAVVVIEGRDLVKFLTSVEGEYYKLLLPGTYTLIVSTFSTFQ